MAQPVQDGSTALGGRFVEAPVLGIVNGLETAWLVDAGRYLVGATAAAMLFVAMNGQMLDWPGSATRWPPTARFRARPAG